MQQTEYWFIFQTPISPIIAVSINNQILCSIFSQSKSLPLKYLESYPNVIWKKDLNESLIQLQNQIELYFKGELKQFSLNLNFEGTDFQKTCWNFLNTIPYGTTISYADQAASIHNPKAVRACGSANGKNSFHLIIPCHRVITKQGTLGGYSAGINIKKFLLNLENEYSK